MGSIQNAQNGSRQAPNIIPYGPVSSDSSEVAETRANLSRVKTLRTYRIVKTFSLVLCWLCMGTYFTMNTTAIDDLRMLIGCNYEMFSRAFVAKSVGTLLGSVLAGPITDVFPAKMDLVLGVSTLTMCSAALILPLCPSLELMGVSFALQGLGQAALSASGNAHVLSIWGADNSSPFLSLHFGYALGNVIGPLLARPFLMDHSDNDTLTTTFSSPGIQRLDNVFYPDNLGVNIIQHQSNNQNQNQSVVDIVGLNFGALKLNGFGGNFVPINSTESMIWIPYAISGSVGVLISLIFFIFYCIGLPEEYQGLETSQQHHQQTPGQEQHRGKKFLSTLLPGSCTGGNSWYGIQIFTLLFFFYIANFGKDSALLTFTLPIAIDPHTSLHFTKLRADLLITIASVCGAVGRLSFAFIAKCVPIQPIVFVQIFFVLAAQILLVGWGLESRICFWVGICVFNLFSSPLFPSGIVWADRYVKMTAVAVGLVNVATGVSTFVFTYFAGYVFDYKANGSEWVLYLSLGCSIAMALFMIAMQILGSCHGTRRSNMATGNQNGDGGNERIVYHDDDPLLSA